MDDKAISDEILAQYQRGWRDGAEWQRIRLTSTTVVGNEGLKLKLETAERKVAELAAEIKRHDLNIAVARKAADNEIARLRTALDGMRVGSATAVEMTRQRKRAAAANTRADEMREQLGEALEKIRIMQNRTAQAVSWLMPPTEKESE